MPNEFVARNGIIALNNSIITGSLNVTQGVTASLFGTSSWATNALTSSYILSAVSASFASTASNVLGGTTNYIPLFNNATTLSSSVMYQSSSNIGIGTTSPTQKLEVNGNIKLTSGGYLYGDGSDAYLVLTNANGSKLAYGSSVYFEALAASANIRASSENINIFNNNGRITLSGSGAVGIGTTSPIYKLDVSGEIRTTGNVPYFLLLERSANFGVYARWKRPDKEYYLALDINNNGGTDFTLYDGTAGASRLVVSGDGNIGIGTATPNAKLDVNGNTIITGSLTVTSTITAQTLVVQTITSSVDFVTGSTRFGTLLSNTHQFTGSVSMTGSLSVVGNGITSSLFGTSSWASNSISASQAQNAVTASYILNAVSASFASTASNVLGGAASYIPLWNTATSLSSSVMYQSSGNVGIGTTSPNAKLDVSGSAIISGSLTVNPGAGNELLVSSTGLSIGNIVSDVHNVTGSLRISGSVITTGSVSATNFTGSLFGTSSWSSNVVSSSYALTALSSSFATSASQAQNAVTASYALTALSSSFATSASSAVSSSFALSASWAPIAGTTVFPYTGSALFTGSIILTGSLTTSLNANIGGNASVSGSLVVSGSQYTYGVANTSLSATNVITSISTGSYRAAFFNYVMTSGSNARAGQIASVWYINTCSFSEAITTDIGTTVGQEMSARISGSFIQLVASSSANWTIETSVNLI